MNSALCLFCDPESRTRRMFIKSTLWLLKFRHSEAICNVLNKDAWLVGLFMDNCHVCLSVCV